ncbi:hypothetical protein ACNKHK_10825 [Shigella flexneri]
MQNGIVRVDTSSCTAAVTVLVCVLIRFVISTRSTKVADKCDFCAESRLAKGFPPIRVMLARQHALIFAAKIARQIQTWLRENKYYEYQLAVLEVPICIVGSVNI